jgi:hypothetical protein
MIGAENESKGVYCRKLGELWENLIINTRRNEHAGTMHCYVVAIVLSLFKGMEGL